ncbi:hypothetical protein NIES267_55070 [Calothrix parasitica NIES-267]|uniref:Uncharacterized protein n=1 Tax=Calothrix parasitica NIES-267 TaxID=1973488 RepID=A0A1Z4LXX5_9CYAN|nr:hypothetical protein NIES267_55070 [Calothrix parasitica NIES-267]
MGDKYTACERYNVCALHEHQLATEECDSTCQIRSERSDKPNNVTSFENYKHAQVSTSKSEN